MWRALVASLVVLVTVFSGQVHASLGFNGNVFCHQEAWLVTVDEATTAGQSLPYVYDVDARLYNSNIGVLSPGGSGTSGPVWGSSPTHFIAAPTKCPAGYNAVSMSTSDYHMLIDAAQVASKLAEMSDMAVVGGAGFSMLMGFILGYRAAQRSSSQ